MNLPLVSVVVVTYNQAPFVREALESVATQDYEELDIVVSDDGSTDGTAELVTSLAKSHPERIRVLAGQPHVGVTNNYNRCLRACRGDLIAFCDGDDMLLPRKISAQVDWFDKHPDGVLCGHDVEYFDSSSGATIGRWSDTHALAGGLGAAQLCRHAAYPHHLSVMVRRTAMPAGGFDSRLPISSDWKFMVDCLAHGGRFGMLADILARYRRHSGGVSQNPQTRVAAGHDHLLAADLISTQHPQLASCVPAIRQEALCAMAGGYLLQQQWREARRCYGDAWAARPFGSSQPPLGYLLALMPTPVVRALLKRRHLDLA